MFQLQAQVCPIVAYQLMMSVGTGGNKKLFMTKPHPIMIQKIVLHHNT